MKHKDWKDFLSKKAAIEFDRRNRLIEISDMEAINLSAEDKYDRNKYLAEIYAHKQIGAWKRSLPSPVEVVTKQRYGSSNKDY